MKKKDGEIEKVWVNQQTTDSGTALDLHSLSIMQHPRFGGEPITCTQIKLGTGLYTTNLGLLTSEQLHAIKTEITKHLVSTGYYAE